VAAFINNPNFWHNTTPFITPTNSYVQALMKQQQKKLKLTIFVVILFSVIIVNKLGPYREARLHKLDLRDLSGFPNTHKFKLKNNSPS